jgi:hypothetical protein
MGGMGGMGGRGGKSNYTFRFGWFYHWVLILSNKFYYF